MGKVIHSHPHEVGGRAGSGTVHVYTDSSGSAKEGSGAGGKKEQENHRGERKSCPWTGTYAIDASGSLAFGFGLKFIPPSILGLQLVDSRSWDFSVLIIM